MDELIAEIEAYAAAAGRTPQSVIRGVCGYGGGVWGMWKARKSSPTLANADRIREWMAANPPSESPSDAA